jgi:hypothetical protein
VDQSIIINQHFHELSQKYPGMYLAQKEGGLWSVIGRLDFIAKYGEEQVEDGYEIEMAIPVRYPELYPSVRETGNRIPRDFHQSGDILCLGAQVAVLQKFLQEPTLLGFTERCLIPYLYAFSYKAKFGKLPFGELAHGWQGILQYYQEKFHIQEPKAVLGLLRVLAENRYHGHARCPCGSRKKLHDCHGKMLRQLMRQLPASWYSNDYVRLLENLSILKFNLRNGTEYE